MDLTNEDVIDILALLDSLPYDELDLQTSRFRLTLRRTPDGWTQAVETRVAPTVVDAAGLVVTAGFVDLHSHVNDLAGLRLQALDGVTTALELEAGASPVAAAYRSVAAEVDTTSTIVRNVEVASSGSIS